MVSQFIRIWHHWFLQYTGVSTECPRTYLLTRFFLTLNMSLTKILLLLSINYWTPLEVTIKFAIIWLDICKLEWILYLLLVFTVCRVCLKNFQYQGRKKIVDLRWVKSFFLHVNLRKSKVLVVHVIIVLVKFIDDYSDVFWYDCERT